MGGPSYQTPFPVDDHKGGQVIWNWGTQQWSPYKKPATSGDPAATRGEGDATGAAGGPDYGRTDSTPGDKRDPTGSGSGSSPGPSFGGSGGPGGSGSQQNLRRRTLTRRPAGLPGMSLLTDRGDF